MFKKILIANRGEIAVRILRACASWTSVPSPSLARWTANRCTSAFRTRPIHRPSAFARELSSIDKLMDVARRAGCDAVHPGYGFLAENAALPRACTDRGLTSSARRRRYGSARLQDRRPPARSPRRRSHSPGINDPIESPPKRKLSRNAWALDTGNLGTSARRASWRPAVLERALP